MSKVGYSPESTVCRLLDPPCLSSVPVESVENLPARTDRVRRSSPTDRQTVGAGPVCPHDVSVWKDPPDLCVYGRLCRSIWDSPGENTDASTSVGYAEIECGSCAGRKRFYYFHPLLPRLRIARRAVDSQRGRDTFTIPATFSGHTCRVQNSKTPRYRSQPTRLIAVGPQHIRPSDRSVSSFVRYRCTTPAV